MAMIPTAYDRMDDRLDAFVTALRTYLQPPNTPVARVVKDELLHFGDQPDAELDDGIVTVVSDNESGYRKSPGMAAKEGTQRLILVGHLKVAETATAKDVQIMEMDMMEEIKAFVRAGVDRMSLDIDRCQGSRQLEMPYGWFVVLVDAGSPAATIR